LRIIVGVSGASGSIYGFRLLEKLRKRPDVEVHLILSRAAERTAHLEIQRTVADFRSLADHVHPFEDIGSRLASGSFRTDGMVIAPCSIQSMSAIASGVTSNLLVRAADVCLKERRRLILLVRETPFHLGHLKTMLSLTEMGAIIAPPIPGFYHNPQTILDLVDHTIDRVLDLLQIPSPDTLRWDGRRAVAESEEGTGE
jgi:4-hydroxy-3-polyprenylbenzoate decarboxylase